MRIDPRDSKICNLCSGLRFEDIHRRKRRLAGDWPGWILTDHMLALSDDPDVDQWLGSAFEYLFDFLGTLDEALLDLSLQTL